MSFWPFFRNSCFLFCWNFHRRCNNLIISSTLMFCKMYWVFVKSWDQNVLINNIANSTRLSVWWSIIGSAWVNGSTKFFFFLNFSRELWRQNFTIEHNFIICTKIYYIAKREVCEILITNWYVMVSRTFWNDGLVYT